MSEEYRDKDKIQDQDDDNYEKICFICRRPESRAGKMVRMPGNMDICPDCMQKAFNSLQGGQLGDYQEILKNYPGMGMDMINLSDLRCPNARN